MLLLLLKAFAIAANGRFGNTVALFFQALGQLLVVAKLQTDQLIIQPGLDLNRQHING